MRRLGQENALKACFHKSFPVLIFIRRTPDASCPLKAGGEASGIRLQPHQVFSHLVGQLQGCGEKPVRKIISVIIDFKAEIPLIADLL